MNTIPLFIDSLGVMLRGMLGIFAVILVIYAVILVLNKVFARNGQKNQ